MLGRPFTYPLQRPRVPAVSVRRFPAVTLSIRHLPLTTAPRPTSRIPPSACGASPPSHSREDAPLRLRHPLLRREYLKSACGASLGVIAVGGLDPREHLAQFLTRGLDRVGLLIGAELLELRGA